MSENNTDGTSTNSVSNFDDGGDPRRRRPQPVVIEPVEAEPAVEAEPVVEPDPAKPVAVQPELPEPVAAEAVLPEPVATETVSVQSTTADEAIEAAPKQPVFETPTTNVEEPIGVEPHTDSKTEVVETANVKPVDVASVEAEIKIAADDNKSTAVNTNAIEQVQYDRIPVAETASPAAESHSETPAHQISKAGSVEVAEAEIPETAAHPEPADETKADEPKAEAAEPETSEPVNGFRKLALSERVLEAVELSGYNQPTDIQAQIIPFMLDKRDVLAQSQTGTGKTAGFALPVLSQLKPGFRKPQVLVLTPTRELAMQVAASFQTYARCLPDVNVAAIYGGADYGGQFRKLKSGVQIVVGTPGRVIDHIKRGSLQLTQIDCLVLDEADEMLNMGFLDDVKFVLEQAPDEIQIALFSATLPAPIRTIAQRYLTDPARITIKSKTMTADSIRQRAIFVSPREKIAVLTRILEAEETDGVIVFTKTRESTVVVADKLNGAGLRAVALNGDMPQKTRERTIQQLKSNRLDILVATDVAARGLDVSRISHVFNYDLPHGTESYIHRIGRTGRAGRKGEAIIFLMYKERYRLRSIEKVTKQQIEIVEPPDAKTINEMRIKQFKAKITEVVESPERSFFRKMLEEHAAETGQPMEDIAAALALIGQNGRPFFMTERPRTKPTFDESDRRSNGRPDRSQFRKGRPANDNAQNGNKRRERELGPPEPGLARYRIEVGWRDGVKPGNLVGAIANEGGIAGKDIGPIKIHDAYSTVDLPEKLTNDVYQALKETRVVGKHLRLKPATKADSEPRSGGQSSYGKPGRQFGGKKKGGKRFFGKKKPGGKKRKAK